MNIHFIWWGEFGNSLIFDSINAAAREVGSADKVYFWCKDSAMKSYISGRNSTFASRTARVKDGFFSAAQSNTLFMDLHQTMDVDSRVIVRNVKSFGEIFQGPPGSASFGGFGGPAAIGSQVRQNAVLGLEALDQYRAFAAVKDLMGIIILYVYGGLLMDTTVEIIGRENRKSGNLFKDGINTLRRERSFKVPFVYSSGGESINELLRVLGVNTFGQSPPMTSLGGQLNAMVFQPGATEDFEEIANGCKAEAKRIAQDLYSHDLGVRTAASREATRENVVTVPRFDVWAMYSPQARAGCVLRMIEGYATRLKYSGLAGPLPSDPIKKEIGGEVIHIPRTAFAREIFESAANGNQNDKINRNSLICSFAMYSVQEGLTFQYKGNYSYGWVTITHESSDGSKSMDVPDLGVTKHYRNSWRGL